MGPIGLAVALSRVIAVRCPHCRQHNLVTRRPTLYWTCTHCYLRFTAPGSRKR